MRIAWLADRPQYTGGAELTQAEFRVAAPTGTSVIGITPTTLDHLDGCEVACVFNTVTYLPETIQALEGKRIVRYWNDMAPHGSPELRSWLLQNATNVFCSPLHVERFMVAPPEYELIPPPVGLDRFTDAAASSNGNRRGSCSVAAWMNPGKAPERVAEWGMKHGGVMFYGAGPFAPPESVQVSQQELPALLASFERFVFLPTAVEPFGRAVVEAWAAGCELVINGLVGARYWIENDPDAISTAAEDFWELVLR